MPFAAVHVPLACVPAISAALRAATDLFLPRVCLLCEGQSSLHGRLICDGCWRNVDILPRPACARCGHPTVGEPCRWCALIPETVHQCRSVCWVPDGAGGEMVHKLKYDGWTRLGAEMAMRIARVMSPPQADGGVVLVPVPLGSRRLRERGYNQSRLIADALSFRWRIPVEARALARVRETRSQVRLTPDERSANVHAAFAAGPAADVVRDRHVVLVDDVVTTGATLNACAAAVVAAGARTLSYVTFGRARAAFDRGRPRRSA